MYKTPQEQVEDARYYLQDGTLDVPRADRILAEINWEPKVTKGTEIAIIPGHVYGVEEQQFNHGVAGHLRVRLEEMGFSVYIHIHTLEPYTARINEMVRAINNIQPNNQVCVELHYNAVDSPEPNGHHFQYNRAKPLAESMRNAWQNHFPKSEADRDNGIYYNPDDRGSYFLRKAPGWACLCEPFFRSNSKEWAFFKNKQKAIAYAYAEGIKNFIGE